MLGFFKCPQGFAYCEVQIFDARELGGSIWVLWDSHNNKGSHSSLFKLIENNDMTCLRRTLCKSCHRFQQFWCRTLASLMLSHFLEYWTFISVTFWLMKGLVSIEQCHSCLEIWTWHYVKLLILWNWRETAGGVWKYVEIWCLGSGNVSAVCRQQVLKSFFSI